MPFDRTQYRVAVFDIDGTIYAKGAMHEEVRDAITRLAQSGVQTVIATGRHPFNLPKPVEELDCIRYVIGLNGGMIADVHTREVLSLIAMDTETARETVKTMISVSPHVHTVYETYGDITAEDMENLRRKRETMAERDRIEREFRRIYRVRADAQAVLDGVRQPMIKAGIRFGTEAAAEAGAATLRTLLDNEISVTDTGMVEVTPRGVSKAKGLEILCERLGCTPENAVAFGDSGNDINIMRRAGFAVAVGNAMEGTKAIADYVTDSVEEAGVAKAIRALWNV